MSSWAQGIIVSIIIGSIILMILPESKNKKYIKMVIGVYILFSIISPVVGKSINFDDYDLEKYLNITVSNESNDTYTYDENVKNTFKNNIIVNIKSQLNSKGYYSENIEVEINDECKIIKIKISDIYENKKEDNKNDQIVINKVDTNINSVDITEKRVERYGNKR